MIAVVEIPLSPANPKARKPKPAPERRITLLEPPSADTDGWFAIRIDIIDVVRQAKRTEAHHYLAREVPADGMGQGCRGFEVEKLGPDLFPTGDVYHVLLDRRTGYSSCDCAGGTYHDHCKHREGLTALINAGALAVPIVAKETIVLADPRHRSGGDAAANDPILLQEHLASLDGFAGEPADEIPPPRELAYGPEAPEAWPGERSEPHSPEDDPAFRGWEFPDEPPELPHHADFDPADEDIDPEPPNRAA